MRPARKLTIAMLALVLAVVLTSCGGSAKSAAKATSSSSPAALLARSRSVLDATKSVHFALASTGISSSASTALVSGSGDLLRPDRLKGSFSIRVSGFEASVGIVVVGNTLYAKPPFASHYSATNPSTYGIGNPAQLLSPTNGVSSLLTSISHSVSKGSTRLAGELLDVVSGEVPGDKVPVLPDKNKSEPVQVTASIDPSSGQLRRIALVGPFTSASSSTTYTVTLTRYGEPVTVSAPTT